MMDQNVEILVHETEEGEARIPAARKQGRWRILLASVMLGAGILGSIVASYGWKASLSLRRVVVDGNRIVSAEEIVERAKVKSGMRLYDLDLGAIRSNVLSEPYALAADVWRELPDILRISLQERVPIAAIVTDRIMYLDEEGFVLPPYEGAVFDVPFIRGVEPVSVADRMENTAVKLFRALELLKQAHALTAEGSEIYHLISEVHVGTGGDLTLYSSDGGARILLGRTDAIGKLHTLEAFWEQVVHERGADRLRLVDLRFEDQVIARWEDEQPVRVRQ